MEYFNNLISTGNMNLFLVQERGKDGYYAESLENGVVCYISHFKNQISFLREDKLLTYNSKISLDVLFEKMKANEKDIPAFNAHKGEVKEFFRKIVPEYNEKRVLIKYLRKIIYQFDALNSYEKNRIKSKSISEKWIVEKPKPMRVTNNLKLA